MEKRDRRERRNKMEKREEGDEREVFFVICINNVKVYLYM